MLQCGAINTSNNPNSLQVMPSHLTRHVFRRLLHDQPVIRHAAPTRHPFLRPFTHHGRAIINTHHARTFMNIFGQSDKDLREPFMDPGMEKMLELDKRIHLVARLPPRKDLALAFNSFIAAKRKTNLPIQDFHATRLVQTLDVIESAQKGDHTPGLSYNDLLVALQLLGESSLKLTAPHAQLARMIYKSLDLRVNEGGAEVNKERILYLYAMVLARTGNASESRNLLVDARDSGSCAGDDVWASLISIFSSNGQDEEVRKTLQVIKGLGNPITLDARRELILHYATHNDTLQVKKYFTEDLLISNKSNDRTKERVARIYKHLLEFALRNHEMEWAKQTLDIGKDNNPNLPSWDAIFQAAVIAGKSVDDINRMISIMARKDCESGGDGLPSIDTFNGLIELAVKREDPYSAERYFALTEKWGVKPNAKTYILQVDYRLAAKDFDGAQSAYAHLRDQPITANEDWDIMNRFLQTLVVVPGTPHELVMGIVEDLSERKAIFPAETVKALCRYHIIRDEYLETVDLLQTYAFQFDIAQRTDLCNLLVSLALEPNTESGRCWDTYMIFHQVFDIEAQREPRERVMIRLYQLGRPDLATHVFTRMSKHIRANTRPNAETYIAAFEGTAYTRDAAALEVVHNLLKLDTEVEPSTRMRNALMLAYSAIGVEWRSLEFWDDIAKSEEGPTYESLHIAFRACEKIHLGHRSARAIWTRLIDSDIEIQPDLFASYVGALAGNSCFDDVVDVMSRMEDITGSKPDEFVIGTVFNATPGVSQQVRVEEWAHDYHNYIWRELVSKGVNEYETGIRELVSIDRSLRA
ncbi:hypothetical protein FH972_023145 [Carpinus fangiana]|uniref:Pentacotripeptide-repeat region of PRORP domain-containing protein n=1 Tax=Carpinus fangiana TaxID=176857 RepID=A0A5N6KUR6_9ROSI|nr:hypothetical protein FH972_023145 [Carpinus fangiana]